MAYAIKFRHHEDYGYSETLVEVPARELAAFTQAERDAGGWEVRPFTRQQAAQFVRSGGHHETRLYIDFSRSDKGRVVEAR